MENALLRSSTESNLLPKKEESKNSLDIKLQTLAKQRNSKDYTNIPVQTRSKLTLKEPDIGKWISLIMNLVLWFTIIHENQYIQISH